MSYELEPRALNVNSAATYMGVHRSTIYRLVRDGAIKARKVAGRTVFLRDELDRFLEACPSTDLAKPSPKQSGK